MAARSRRNPSLLTISRRYDYASGEPETPFESVTTYNNFYEFGTDKGDPARKRAHVEDRVPGP